MQFRIVRAFALLLAIGLSAGAGPVFGEDAGAAVRIGGEVAHRGPFDATGLARGSRTMTIHGERAEWSGYALADVLARAGAPHGEALRGPKLALYVQVACADGYRVVFSLAELDPALGREDVLLADRRDGKPLDAKEGPWRLVVPDDRRPARSARQIVAIDVLGAPQR